MCCPLVFEFSVGIGGFVIGLGQISFFFSSNKLKIRILSEASIPYLIHHASFILIVSLHL